MDGQVSGVKIKGIIGFLRKIYEDPVCGDGVVEDGVFVQRGNCCENAVENGVDECSGQTVFGEILEEMG